MLAVRLLWVGVSVEGCALLRENAHVTVRLCDEGHHKLFLVAVVGNSAASF